MRTCAFCCNPIVEGREAYAVTLCKVGVDSGVIHSAHTPGCTLGSQCKVCTCARCMAPGFSSEQHRGQDKFLIACTDCELRYHKQCLGECVQCKKPLTKPSTSWSWFQKPLVVSKKALPSLTKDLLKEHQYTMAKLAKTDLQLADLLTLEMGWRDLRVHHNFTKKHLKRFWEPDMLMQLVDWDTLQKDLELNMDDIVQLQPSLDDLQTLGCTGKSLQNLKFSFHHLMKLPWDMPNLLLRLNFKLDQFGNLTPHQKEVLVKERGLTQNLM